MIPKIIHYCWFGKNKLPKKHEEFIEGWKRLMPEYNIKCWNESLIDIDTVPFIKEAFINKKYAFVADYIRIYALFMEGGIYLDTDVKVFKRFDEYLEHGFFSSFECHPRIKKLNEVDNLLSVDGLRKDKSILKIPGIGIMSAIIGAEKGHPFMNDMLNFYNSISFHEVFENGLIIPTTLALNAEKYGFRYIDKKQELSNNIVIYPTNIFSHYEQKSKNSVAVHYCVGSWVNATLMQQLKKKLNYLKIYRMFKEFVIMFIKKK